jgi:hypothetical protein
MLFFAIKATEYVIWHQTLSTEECTSTSKPQEYREVQDAGSWSWEPSYLGFDVEEVLQDQSPKSTTQCRILVSS